MNDAEPASQTQTQATAVLEAHPRPLYHTTAAQSVRSALTFNRRAMLVTLLGGILTGGLLGNPTSLLRGQADVLEIAQVAVKDIPDAGDSLNLSYASKLIDDAKNCREPLSYVTIKSLGAKGGSVQLLTETYQSTVLYLSLIHI